MQKGRAQIVSVLIICLTASLSYGYFSDDFGGATLDARWIVDNSIKNPTGSNISVVAGQAKGIDTYQNYYNHIETSIDASGDFAVQVDIRNEQTGGWGPSLVVHWDATHFIVLKALKGTYFRSDVYNGSTFTTKSSSLVYPGGQMCTLRIEFGEDTIKFYAKNQGQTNMTYLSGLDIVRSAWTKTASALMIIGKGFQSSAYTNPNYDNDYLYTSNVLDQLIMDNAVYERIGTWCGDPNTVFMDADFNRDCYVNFEDFAGLASEWLKCSDPEISGCSQYWQSDFKVWQVDPYINFVKTLAPGSQNPPLENITVKLAQGEFRDALFMIGPYTQDRTININIEKSSGIPDGAILVQETLYLLNYTDEVKTSTVYTGDAVYPLTGPLFIPSGESRQIRLRFDARYSGIEPNDYKFAVAISDATTGQEQVIPGLMTVWDFNLPSNNVLRVNSYAQFHNSEFSDGQAFINGVKAMKLYGVNTIYHHSVEMPKATDVDDSGNIVSFNSSVIERRLSTIMLAWHDAPGDERLEWVFDFEDLTLGMTRTDIVYPSQLWKTVFAQWLSRFKTILANYGVADDEWCFTLGDEEYADRLMAYTIPLAELIKSVDPTIKLYCNSSAYLTFPGWAARYLAVFDTFSPHITEVEGSRGAPLLNWLQSSGKSVCSYRCCPDMGRLDGELYNYYRVYGWKLIKYNLKGLGHWTYSSQGYNPWEQRPNQGYMLAFKHWSTDEVVRSRRYEMHREGIDDYRYIYKLRQVAAQVGGQAVAEAENLINIAITDILNDVTDHTRCDKWRIKIAEKILSLEGLTISGYFTDQFDTGSLDLRWTEDNSPQNPSGSGFVFWDAPGWLLSVYPGMEGHQLYSQTNYLEAYHHIQTAIDTNANFSVATSIRCNEGQATGAGHLAVYWDATHYVGLAAGRDMYVSRELYDGTSLSTLANSYEESNGWAWYSLKIEFTDTAVKFYIGKSGAESLADPNYHPELDMVRESWMTADALLIVGKGMGVGGGFDFNNDGGTIGGGDEMYIDFASYQPMRNCGDPGTRFLQRDLNKDCQIDFADFIEIATNWLLCNDPVNNACN